MEESYTLPEHFAQLARECGEFVGKRVVDVEWLFWDSQSIECCDPSSATCSPQKTGDAKRNWFLWLRTPDWTIRDRAGVVLATRPSPEHRSLGFKSLIVGADIVQMQISGTDSALTVRFSNGNSLCTGACVDGVDETDNHACWVAIFPDHAALEVGYNGQRWKRVLTEPRTRKKA